MCVCVCVSPSLTSIVRALQLVVVVVCLKEAAAAHFRSLKSIKGPNFIIIIAVVAVVFVMTSIQQKRDRDG